MNYQRQWCSILQYNKLAAVLKSCRRPSTTIVRVKIRPEKTKHHNFVDYRRVRVIGGTGGNGLCSFLSMPMKEWAGPDGGDGGNGGHIIFIAKSGENSLVQVKSLYKGNNGENGMSKCCFGKNAEHTYIPVPIGTLFKDENHNLVADLNNDGDIFVAARGGAGGKGNHFFLTNENRAPTTYEVGGKGEDCVYHSELRIMAHIGLVGFPNAGKSTLLRAVSRARPKVAAYPFTTLKPHVGIIEYPSSEQVAVADIPGLIRGAHLDYGLGISFLRHIQRSACLLFVIDLSVDSPWEQFEDLKFELDQYDADLSKRPHAIIGNKMDLPQSEGNLAKLKDIVQLPVIAVSAKYGKNVPALLEHIYILYKQNVT